jgi:tungstate transport system permease protein
MNATRWRPRGELCPFTHDLVARAVLFEKLVFAPINRQVDESADEVHPMQDFDQAFISALARIRTLDPELVAIVALSLRVSLSASIIAMVIGAPLAGLLAISRFRGQQALIVLVNALLGLPPVVVGLAVYLVLSRSGPLGFAGLLFTPAAMVMAQTVLATPIVIALVHRAVATLWLQYGDLVRIDGAPRGRAILELFAIGRGALLTAFLAAFGRAIAEVGAIIVVGGNIRGYTRTMTTTIALETSKGNLSLAFGLGLVLILLSVSVSAAAFVLDRWSARKRN